MPECKIISFRAVTALSQFDPKRCPHDEVIVDEQLWSIECAKCGEKLDPIAFMVNLGKQEDMVKFRIDELLKYEAEIKNRVRTKCQHCGRMTSISR